MSENQPIRAFVALKIPASTREAMRVVIERLRKRIRRGLVGWVGFDNWHVTLRFLGDIPPTAIDPIRTALAGACANTDPIQLQPSGFGCFPHPRNPRVLWVGVDGDLDPLDELQERVVNATASFAEKPMETRFHPHITIGRVKTTVPTELRQISDGLAAASLRAMPHWTARSVHLIGSTLTEDGAVYRDLAEVALRPATPNTAS